MLDAFISEIRNLEIDLFPLPPSQGAVIKSFSLKNDDLSVLLQVGSADWVVTCSQFVEYQIVSSGALSASLDKSSSFVSIWNNPIFHLSFNGPTGYGEKAYGGLIECLEKLFPNHCAFFNALGLLSVSHTVELLNNGYGTLMNGPKSILLPVVDTLAKLNFKCSVYDERKPLHEGALELLSIGDSWFVAKSFKATRNS